METRCSRRQRFQGLYKDQGLKDFTNNKGLKGLTQYKGSTNNPTRVRYKKKGSTKERGSTTKPTKVPNHRVPTITHQEDTYTTNN